VLRLGGHDLPVPGVRVSAAGTHARTSAAGRAVLRLRAPRARRLVVRASKGALRPTRAVLHVSR
jgi:hypothetical protein